MADVGRKKRLADYGLHSERTLMRKKGPGVFEQELGDLESKIGLTHRGEGGRLGAGALDLA